MLASTWLLYCGYLPSVSSGSAIYNRWADYGRRNRSRFSTRSNDLTPEITFLDCLDSARCGRKAHNPRGMVYAFLAHPDGHVFLSSYHNETALAYCRFARGCDVESVMGGEIMD
jgi:hypothetical protein